MEQTPSCKAISNLIYLDKVYQIGGFILISTNQDIVLWEKRIKARDESGLSVTEWCKLNEIKKIDIIIGIIK